MAWSTFAMARTKATPEQVWRLWEDVSNWSAWDKDVESSRIHGPFVEGTRGELKPRGGPATAFVLTSVRPLTGFSNRSSLPLARLDFIHTLRVENDETLIEHRLEMSGPLTFLFRRLIGKNLARNLPAVVESLARSAEKRAS